MCPVYDLGGIDLALPPLPDDILTSPRAARADPRDAFAEPARPLDIEIGPGKGSFILAAARHEPAANFLGIERAGEFWAYACDRVRRAGLRNVRLIHADAVDVFRWRFPDSIARAIHLYYSDPWPKARHHKNRVVRDEFLAEAWRVLAPGGELRIVTDHDEYWAWIESHAERWTSSDAPARFERRAFTPPPWAAPGALVETNYERKMTGPQKPPYALVLAKQA